MIAGEVNESRRQREIIAKKTPLIKLPNTEKKSNFLWPISSTARLKSKLDTGLPTLDEPSITKSKRITMETRPYDWKTKAKTN